MLNTSTLQSPQQPLKSPYAITEDVLVDLDSAGRITEQSMAKDDFFPDIHKSMLSHRASQHYTYANQKPIFYRKALTNIPDAVLDQYDSLQYKCFLNILPQIHRAWISIDNKLYLWNYEDPSDFCVYDGLDQIIIGVGMVTPRLGVFVEEIKYLLVVATAVEVVIIAVTLSNGLEGEVSLIPTGLSVPSDNVKMLKIVGTPQGRIFMGGIDGCLYELWYQAEEKWFTKRCKLVNHSTSMLSNLVPSFLKFSQQDPIFEMAVDHTRNILYTLTANKSVIQVYDLGDRGDATILSATQYNVAVEGEKLSPRGVNWRHQDFKLLSLHAIPATESGPIHLVAIANNGIRLYFTTTPGARDDYSTMGRSPPRTLELLHVRSPPPITDPNLRFAGQRVDPLAAPSTLDNVHLTYYSEKAFFMAQPLSQETDMLWGVALDIGQMVQQRNSSNPFYERASTLELSGKVWAIQEEPISRRETLWYSLLGYRIFRNDLAVQHLHPPRKYLCLTNNGLYTLVKLRPVDQLQEILAATGGRDTEELQRFFATYGEDEGCAMCLVLCCSNPASITPLSPTSRHMPTAPMQTPLGLPSTQPIYQTPSMGERMVSSGAPDPNVVAWATRAFFKYGGRPNWNEPTSTPLDISQQQDYGYGAYNTPKILFSFSHDGFSLYFSRLIRPVWFENVTKAFPERRVNGTFMTQICGLSREQLLDLEESLANLKEFLTKNPQFAVLPHSSSNIRNRVITMQKRKADDEAKYREQKSLSSLHLLVIRCMEACSFLEILAANRLARIVENLPQEVQLRLANLKFKDLVSSPEGVQISKELVTGLINLHTSENTSVDSISLLLKQKCPGFFSDADSLRFKGSELIKLAKLARDPREKQELLQKSLDIFWQVTDHLNLSQICHEYLSLHFYTGIVQLALNYAAKVDPSGAALQWHLMGRPLQDDLGRRLFEVRMECYNCITTVFDTLLFSPPTISADPRDLENLKLKTLQSALDSKDELFHYSLYQWYLDRGLSDELLQIQSPYLENFLKNVKKDYSTLWKFYLRNEQFTPAATVLVMLAEKKGEGLLEQKLEYLARAKSCLSRNTSVVPMGATHLEELSEKLEVAKVQHKIYQELKTIPGTENELRELDSELMNVTDLYNKYAKKYKLWESQLSILHISAHNDPILVKKIWENIIRKEFEEQKVTPLMDKIRSLGAELYPSDLVFPLGYLVDILERSSLELKHVAPDWTIDWVLRVMREIRVPYPILFEVYDHTFDSKGSFWSAPEAQFHLLEVLYLLIFNWAEMYMSAQATDYDKRQFLAKSVDSAIEKYVTELSPYREATELLNRYKNLSKLIFTRR